MVTLGFGKPTIRSFGKLPIAGDFLSHGASRGPAEEWRTWMSSAFADEAITSAKTLTNRIYRFWYRGDREGLLRTPVAGFLMDSTDRLRRRFPFSWYTTAGNGGKLGEGAVRSGVPVWNALGGLLPRLSSIESAEQLYELLTNAPIARLLDQEQAKELKVEATMGELLEALFSGDPKKSMLFLGKLQRIFSLSDGEGAKARLAVKLPLNSGYSAESQALVWLKLLDGRPGGAKADAPNLLLPGDRRSSDPMFIFYRDLNLEDGHKLFMDNGSSPGFFDLSKIGEAESDGEDEAAGQRAYAAIDLNSPISELCASQIWSK